MADRAVNLETVIGMVNTYFRNVLNLNPDLLIDGIVSLPTVDAVPVVRCKDCKYWRRDTDHTCKEHSLVSPMTADDFCSYGKKDGDHETD